MNIKSTKLGLWGLSAVAFLILGIEIFGQLKIITNLKEKNRLFDLKYHPIKEKIVVSDTIVFYPGIVESQPMEFTYRPFIFELFSKRKINLRGLTYKASQKSNPDKLVLTSDKTNSLSVSQMDSSKLLEEYVVDLVRDDLNEAELTKLDTLKLYLNQGRIIPNKIVAKYYTVEFTKSTLDSLIFVRIK